MRQTAAVVVFVISWGDLVPTRSMSQSDDLEVTIRIHAARGVRAAWTSGARPIVARILAAACVRTVWTDCIDDDGTNPACSRSPAPSEFVVRIMARPEDPDSKSCGNAQTPEEGLGHYVSVFQHCVATEATQLRIDEAVLGAHIIVHEIGHLLLPVGHAPTGIMRQRLDRSDWMDAVNGTLAFHPAEVQEIVAELRRRRVTAAGGASRR